MTAGFNGTGTYVRGFSWATDKSNSVAVTASRVDTEDDAFAVGLSTCICKDGQTTTTARIPFALGIGVGTGTVALPALNFSSDTDTGIYSIGANNIGIACGGAKVLDIGTGGLGVTGTLSATGTSSLTGNVTVGASLIVTSSASIGTGLTVGSTLGVTGNATLSASLSVGGTLAVTGAMNTTTNATVGGTLTVASSASVGTGLAVGSTLTVTGNATLSASASVGGSLAVTGAATLSSTLGVTGVATLSGGVGITGAATISGSLTAGGTVGFSGIGTTASAANAFLDPANSNNLLRSTSSRRYKTDIENITYEEARQIISRLRPIKFHSKAKNDDPDRQHFGLIAEEVAEVDPRLVHLTKDGKPDGVQYERVLIPMLKLMQEARV